MVTVTSRGRETERVALGEECSERGFGCSIEVGLAARRDAIGGIEGREDQGLTGVESLVALPFLFHEDQDFAGIRTGDVADALNFAVTETLSREALAQTVNIRRLGKAHVHVGAFLEVNAVAQRAPLLEPREETEKEEES